MILRETPSDNSDLVLFVDGLAFLDPATRKNKVGYAVCTAHDILESAPLTSHFSAQAAELVALTAACTLAAGQSATIYTDSCYAFGSSPSLMANPSSTTIKFLLFWKPFSQNLLPFLSVSLILALLTLFLQEMLEQMRLLSRLRALPFRPCLASPLLLLH